LEERHELRQRVDADRDRTHVLDVGCHEHRVYASVRKRLARVDTEDPRMCMRTTNDRRVQRSRRLEVRDVAAAPAHEARVLLAPHAGADQPAHRPKSLAALS
jgi:hypothetical protein